jgi:hypothetical protein
MEYITKVLKICVNIVNYHAYQHIKFQSDIPKNDLSVHICSQNTKFNWSKLSIKLHLDGPLLYSLKSTCAKSQEAPNYLLKNS